MVSRLKVPPTLLAVLLYTLFLFALVWTLVGLTIVSSFKDVVFLDEGLSTIITAIKVARQIFHRMKGMDLQLRQLP